MRIAVIDSSVLINLAHLNLAPKLSLFFDKVYVPRGVQGEVNRKRRFRYHLNKLYRTSVLERCAAANETNVRLLQPDLDLGEAEAIIQAQERRAVFFIGDEKRARDIAENIGLKTVGTLRILARLQLEGEAPQLHGMVAKLRRDVRFRVSDNLVKAAAESAFEPI